LDKQSPPYIEAILTEGLEAYGVFGKLFGAFDEILAGVGGVGSRASNSGGPSLVSRTTLEAQDVADIQRIADKYEIRIDVGGSRARGAGRNIDQHSLPVDKGTGTRSDIDFIFDIDHPKAKEIMAELRKVGGGAGSLHPDVRFLYGFPDAADSNLCRFRFGANQQPTVIKLPPE